MRASGPFSTSHRALHPIRPPHSVHPVFLLLLLLCAAPRCLSLPSGSRQQHNVWYSGLFISGIAVDESTGDVFFSDAAANRVVRQSVNGTVLDVYALGFYSPMQLAYYSRKLYVADSSNNRVAILDVSNGGAASYSTKPPHLGSCDGVAVNTVSGHLYLIDGWGQQLDVYMPESGQWAAGRHTDLSRCVPDEAFVASVSVQPSDEDDGSVFVGLPPRLSYSDPSLAPLSTPNPAPLLRMSNGASAVQLYSQELWYALTQEGADEPMEIYVFNDDMEVVEQWITSRRSKSAIPFYGWALYVDSSRNMYYSSASDAVSTDGSSHGRVVKMAPNGTELSEWSMSDGTAYSFTSVGYDDNATTAGWLCAYWMADSENGLVRVAADGSVLLPFYTAPIDQCDGLTARFTGLARDGANLADVNGSALVLLDTSSNATTKLWRFSLSDHIYTPLNLSVQLGPHIVGVAVDSVTHAIYVSDTRTRSVLRLHASGELDASFNTSGAGLVQPAGLVVCRVFLHSNSLCVSDSAYNMQGAVLLMDGSTGAVYKVLNDTTPRMHQPTSVAFDNDNHLLYAADGSGLIFEFNLYEPYLQRAVHQPAPAARDIVSMTVGGKGKLYCVDSYSRRLIIIRGVSGSWPPGNECMPPPPPMSSSSSGLQRATLSVAGVVAAVAVAATVGASCWYMKWRKRQRQRSNTTEMREQLIVHEERMEEEDRESKEEEDDDDGYTAVSMTGATSSMRNVSEAPSATRYTYYVARYEVVAALTDMAQLEEWDRQTSHSTGTPPFGSGPLSASLHSTASTLSDSSTSTEHDQPAQPQPVTAAATATSAFSPPHIAQLHSAWRANTAPTFIDCVTDLTILGEGSSGVVYHGIYCGLACVVKLPKSVALTGAAWREWQCHLSLPPHANLVRFLGALPMSSTHYLVLAFVRQGSLHSLLSSPTASSVWYSRPYGVMRCMLDVSAALLHIHSCGIVHRDVSARNILVDSDGQYVLADLGLATQCKPATPPATPHNTRRRHSVATPTAQEVSPAVPVRWTSPEALKQPSQYSSKSDVWSLGVALWECTAKGRLPYEQSSRTKVCIQSIVARRQCLQVEQQWGDDDRMCAAERQLAVRVRSLIQRCLIFDVQQRPDSEQLMALAGSEWQQWRVEAGNAADRLDSEWLQYHVEVQQRLGAPTKHSDEGDGSGSSGAKA